MKKRVKILKVDLDKCVGCKACEVICSAFHAQPRYSWNTPDASRIRVFRDELQGVFVPVKGSFYTKAECPGRVLYIQNELPQSGYRPERWVICSFCGAACPARDLFKEPGTGLPLKCDMCESDPPLEEPVCVTWCFVDALTYEEMEVEAEEEEEVKELDVAIESLVDRYGWEPLLDAISRLYLSKTQGEG